MRRLIGAALCGVLAACAAGTPAPERPLPELSAPELSAAAPAASRLTGYLAPGALDGAALLGPPPAPDSLRGRADQARFEETRGLAGTPRWTQAVQDNDIWSGGAMKRYACALGKSLDETQTPAAVRLLHRIELDARTVGTPPKDHYARRRPALGNDRPICVPRAKWLETNASYPSGHAMVGWAWGLVLAELAPDRADGLLKVGREVGESRVVCGVHYESDVEAGRTLGAAMVARLHAEPAFAADIAAARAEIAGAPAAQECPAP